MSIQNIVSLIIVAIIIFLEIKLMINKKSEWLLSVPVIIWMIHAVIFYFSILNIKDNLLVNYWSQALRLEGYITLMMMSIYRYLKYKKEIKMREEV